MRALVRADGTPWLDCTEGHAQHGVIFLAATDNCPACGDQALTHTAERGCVICQIRHDMAQLGAGLNQAFQLAALDPDHQPTARRQGPKVCPPGPDRLECQLTPEGHVALVRELERLGFSAPEWGWVHAYDVEPHDEWRGGVQVRTAGHPRTGAAFWGDGYNDTDAGRVYYHPGF